MGALELVESNPGWLRPEDAEKLLELAQASPGPILEIGAHQGDLLRLDSPRDQYLHRVRYPAGRIWSGIRPKARTRSAPPR